MADDHDTLLARADGWYGRLGEGITGQLIDDLAAALRESQADTDTLRQARKLARDHVRLMPQGIDRWYWKPSASLLALLDLLVDGGGDG
jgi:hypothetical protein